MGGDNGQSDGKVAVATWVGLRETSTPGRGNCWEFISRCREERYLTSSQKAFYHQTPPPNLLHKYLPFTASQASSPQQPTTSFLHSREKHMCSSLPSSLGVACYISSAVALRGGGMRK